MRRIRQITAAIIERTNAAKIETRRIASWQTRSLAMLIACTVPLQEGDENPLLEFAKTLTIDPEEQLMFEMEAQGGTNKEIKSVPVDLTRYSRHQEICKKGHTDEWVSYEDQDYKICRKCDIESRNVAARTNVSEHAVGMFGRSMHGKPMPA